MPTPSIEQRLDELARIVATLPAAEYPGPLEPPPPPGDLVALFERRFNDLRAPGDLHPGVIHVGGMPEAAATIAQLCNGVPRSDIIWSGDQPSDAAGARIPSRTSPADGTAGARIPSRTNTTDPGLAHLVPRDFAVGLTPAFALIASTGSVVLELDGPVDAWPSLLVDRHIVVAGRDQLVPDLPTFYQRLSARLVAQLPSAGDAAPPHSVVGLAPAPSAPQVSKAPHRPIHVCITGCSRTADIEKLLVIPAHGPRQVRIVLCAAPLDWPSLRPAP